MTETGTVYDLGYAPHDGPRLGRTNAMWAIFLEGYRAALGLRRKAKAKVLPWALIGAAMVPAIGLVTLTFFAEGFALEAGSPFASHAEYFNTIGTLSMLFVALVVPTLLIPDRQFGVIGIYASRPVRASDYLLARTASMVALTATYILTPHILLYVGISGLNVNGLWAGLVANASEIGPVLGSTLGYIVGYGTPAFLVAVFVRRVATASGVFVVTMFLTAAFADIIPSTSDQLVHRVMAALALFFHPSTVRDWLFQVAEPATPMLRVGLPAWGSLAALFVMIVATGFLAHRRYRRDL